MIVACLRLVVVRVCGDVWLSMRLCVPFNLAYGVYVIGCIANRPKEMRRRTREKLSRLSAYLPPVPCLCVVFSSVVVVFPSSQSVVVASSSFW